MNDELKEIKKIYGEEMMHMCRDLFPTILETKGRLLQILKNNLAPTHSFAHDVDLFDLYDEFKAWIYSFIDKKNNRVIELEKTPFELMEEAGYTLYECNSEEDIQNFKKYYAPNEELCTFNGRRLNKCYVFFAVKKNVDEIKREDFPNPEREDAYGTSVISIQFSHGNINTLSIKNRYNHTVNNPDATFGNNLENIIPGLTNSFEKHYNLRINQECSRESKFLTKYLSYVKANDGRYYRYNIEDEGMYFCENNIAINYNGDLDLDYAQNKERYILIDQLIVDLKQKRIYTYITNYFFRVNSFIESINSVGRIKKIDVIKKGDNRIIKLIYEDDKEVEIEINKNNTIVGYKNNYVTRIGSYFLDNNKLVANIELNNVQVIDDAFLERNNRIERISLPEVISIGENFLGHNKIIKYVNLPKVESIGKNFLIMDEEIEEISLPNVRRIDDRFLTYNNSLKRIYLPNVQVIGDLFLNDNEVLTSIELPKIEEIGNDFLFHNRVINRMILPKVKIIGDRFSPFNSFIEELELPNVKKIGDVFLEFSPAIKRIYAPKLLPSSYESMPKNMQMLVEGRGRVV